ncbi:MAG: phosphomethylpyrimidine synthase ThiC [Thermotogae bacterium]|nr:phosphomethylpyrimidine synthase ThiC [Thermotogota bacterium]
MTQLEAARKGKITPEIEKVAKEEGLHPEILRQKVAEGTVVIPANRVHLSKNLKRIVGIGEGLRTKVNANLGTSYDYVNVAEEVQKLKVAMEVGADTVMDLSTGGNLRAIRQTLMALAEVPLGSVPVYEAEFEAARKKGSVFHLDVDDFLQAIETHAKDGVDFMTIHAGITLEGLRFMKEQGRTTWIVSRGGGLLAAWMMYHNRENPLYEHFDDVLDIMKTYDVTVSLGDSLRPGSIADSFDRPQIHELLVLGELVDRARKAGVQVMVEGPGHVPLDEIEAQVLAEKKICKGAPFYVLGPLPTDVGAGWDHITGAIGGALAAASGVDFLCYVTPAEHLGLPTPEHVRTGVIAFRIAAHIGDIVKGVKGAKEWDLAMSRARYALDWEAQLRLALDPVRAREIFEQRSSKTEACSMCGPFCPMNLIEKFLKDAQKAREEVRQVLQEMALRE